MTPKTATVSISFTLETANQLLPLVKVVAAEIEERRQLRRRLSRQRDEMESAVTPEGLTDSLSNLDARIYEQDVGISSSVQEIQELGLEVFRLNPLTVHFPGRARNRDIVFCWQEGEEMICHGHAHGEESEPRRPLKVRVVED